MYSKVEILCFWIEQLGDFVVEVTGQHANSAAHVMSRRSRLVTFIQSVLIRCSFRQRRQNRPAAIVTRVLLTCVLALIPTDFAMQQQAMLYAHAPMMMPVAPNAFMPTADVARQRVRLTPSKFQF